MKVVAARATLTPTLSRTREREQVNMAGSFSPKRERGQYHLAGPLSRLRERVRVRAGAIAPNYPHARL